MGLQIHLLIFDTELVSYILPVARNCFVGKISNRCDFFGSFSLSYKFGHLDFGWSIRKNPRTA